MLAMSMVLKVLNQFILCMERKKKISMTVKEQRENPSSGVERTHLSVDVLVTLSLLLPRKKLFCETLRKNFESAEKSLTPALSKKNYITRKIC